MSRKNPNNQPLIRLIVDTDQNHNIDNASVEVRWCIEPALLALLEASEVTSPYLIISTLTPKRGEQTRQIVPLDQGSTYVTFSRGGRNYVSAILVHGLEHKTVRKYKRIDDMDLYETYGQETQPPGRTQIPASENKKWEPRHELFDSSDRHYHRQDLLETHARVQVNVDPELFAAEPNEHILYFVNLWKRRGNEMRDECDYRQRLIFTALVKIWPIAIWSAIQFTLRSTVAIFHLLFGQRGINWKNIIHPWTQPMSWLIEGGKKDNYFYLRSKDGSFSPLSWFFWPFVPGIHIFAGGIITSSLAIASMDKETPEFWKLFFEIFPTVSMIIATLIGGVLLFIGVIVGFVLLVLSITDNGRGEKCAMKIVEFIQYVVGLISRIPLPSFSFNKELTPEQLQKRHEKELEFHRNLACPVDNNIPYVPGRPRLKYRINRFFHKTKSLVCKPFPR